MRKGGYGRFTMAKIIYKFFDNNKIKLLESERDGDTLIRVWIQLLTIAMKCNYQGRLSVTEDKPMTVDEFSKIMGKSKKKSQNVWKNLKN